MSGSKANDCTCDYSYTCPRCQERIDLENADQYADERLERLERIVDALAAKAGIEVPPHPVARGNLRRHL